MKQLYLTLSFCLLLLTNFSASAQNTFVITGKVTDASGTPLKNATVFISGSQRITECDDEGLFRFERTDPGNYQLTVTMVGYSSFSKNIVVQDKSENINIKLKLKEIELQQVNVGGQDQWESYFKGFKQLFLGKSKNGNACIITNPKIINFSTKKGVLYADANDFLIIENPRLGYRIKYLLKTFGYNAATGITLYTGDTNFEPMRGTPAMQAEWDKNRLEAYKGSLMHFLRAVYQNKVLKEGFIINTTIPVSPADRALAARLGWTLFYDARPVRFDTLVRAIDTSFVSLKFDKVVYTYNPNKSTSIKTNSPYLIKAHKSADDKDFTTIKLYTPEAIIDHTGAHRNFTDFLIEGKLAQDRVGDQLPFEYQPPVKN